MSEFNLEILSLILSITAVAVAIVSYLRTNAVSNANLELNIYNMIRNSKISLLEASKQMMALETDTTKKAEYSKKIYNSLVEDLVTAYEEACAKYLDGKVDKKRFEKNFKNDIRNLVSDKDVNDVVDLGKPSAISEYGAILEVYKRWNKKE